MALRRKAKHEEEFEEPRGGCLVPHVLIVTLLLLAIVYVAALLAAHTDGFRSYVQDRLESLVGMPMRVERVRVTPAFSLILERVSCASGLTAGEPGVQVGKLVVSWRARGFLGKGSSAVRELQMRDVYLSLSDVGGGRWEPASVAEFAHRLGYWLGVSIGKPGDAEAGGLGRLMAGVPLKIAGGRVVWWDRDGEVAHIIGLEAECKPVVLGRREIVYRNIYADSMVVRGRGPSKDLRVEFIEIENRTIPL